MKKKMLKQQEEVYKGSSTTCIGGSLTLHVFGKELSHVLTSTTKLVRLSSSEQTRKKKSVLYTVAIVTPSRYVKNLYLSQIDLISNRSRYFYKFLGGEERIDT